MVDQGAVPEAAATLEIELQRVRTLIENRAYQSALTEAQKLAVEAPGNRDVLYSIAVSQCYLRQEPAALETLGRLQALHPDFSRLYQEILGLDKSIRLWDAAAGKPLTTMEPADGGTINVVTFSTDGQTLATAGGDPKIRLWDVASGRQLHAWNRPRGAVLALAFSPRGTFVLAAGSEDGTVQLWEIMPEK